MKNPNRQTATGVVTPPMPRTPPPPPPPPVTTTTTTEAEQVAPESELETRHFIALMGGAHASMRVGPGKFDAPPGRRIEAGGVTYYPVSAEIAEAWAADDEVDRG